MREKKAKKKHNDAVRYIQKWLSILAVILAIGGVFAFGLVVFLANAFGESLDTYNPIWMVYMIPLMFLIATPITVFIAKALYKHIDILTGAMSAVADGKTGVSIQTDGKEAFASVYQNFNKMAAEINGIQDLRTQLVDNFSHELKTPVANINGFAKMLAGDNLSEEKRKKYLNIIIKESARLASLTKDNLFLSKIDAQEIITGKKPYSLSKQIQETAISMETAWSEKNIALTADLEDAEYTGDEVLMESVWQNLLSNAIKFTPKNGEINIALKNNADCIIVAVTDTGSGMSKEVAERVFERYYQGETSHASEGHGLGLSIVKRIVTLCGGSISVESKEGEGSVFTVVLPKTSE